MRENLEEMKVSQCEVLLSDGCTICVCGCVIALTLYRDEDLQQAGLAGPSLSALQITSALKQLSTDVSD